MIKNMQELLTLAKKNPRIVAVAAAEDEHVLQAVVEARKIGIASFVLTGDQNKIIPMLRELGEKSENYAILHADSFEMASALAVEAVKEGRANAIMKGLAPSPVFLKAILQELKAEELLAHVVLLEIPGWSKLLFATDCAVNIDPDQKAKAVFIRYAVSVAHKLGLAKPNVALVTATEAVNPKMKDSVDAEALMQEAARGGFPGAVVGGPFALDNAISLEAAGIKKVTHPGAGEADILVLPDLNAANIFYKSLIFFARAKSAGIILGATVPIILVSRADSEETKLYSIALACAAS